MGDRSNPLLVQSARGTFDLEMSMLSRTMPPPVVGIVRMILSGVLDRIPELRVYFAETNASWIPGLLYMLDDSYSIFRHWYGVDLAMAPSEYVWRHFSFGIVRDPLALRMRELLDLDHIMWGSDFPHSVSSFPESARWLDEIFEGCPDEVRRRVLIENPCAFFGLDPDAELTPTPPS
jgi:predicted TIM-barrel fold metal-dependent hydrolase